MNRAGWLLLVGPFGCATEDVTESADSETTAITGFQSAETCASCHPRQYDEWRQSMHSYAALSPVFDAMAGKAYRDTSGAIGTFCTGCHTPQGALDGEPGSSTAATRSALSREGINCDGCHTATGHDGPTGDAAITRDLGRVRYGPYPGGEYGYHEGVQSDFITTSEFCGSCHDVFAFPGLRIEEAFTEYAESPAAEQGIRCQDCHMGVVPGTPGERPRGPSAIVDGVPMGDREVTSHRFIGPDYSLLDEFPYPEDPEKGAAARLEYQEQANTLMSNALKIDSITAAADGAQVEFTVVVESLVAGHGVPTGFTSERQVWLEVEVTDADGNPVLLSGDLDTYGDLRDTHSWDVQSGAAALDTQLVNYQSTNQSTARAFKADGTFDYNEEGHELTEKEVFPFDATVVAKNNIGPLEQKSHTYRAYATTSPYTVNVTIHYRNLPPYVLRALQLDEKIERLNIYDMTSTTAVLEVETSVAEEPDGEEVDTAGSVE